MRARTMRVKPLALALAVTAVLVSALAGCNSNGSPSADGPLTSSSSRHGTIPNGAQCVPGGQAQTFGDQIFTNFGSAVVVLDRVVLLHPHHERLVGSYAVPGPLAVGAPGGWPPKYQGIPPGWQHRQPVQGYRVAAGKAFNMVLGI